MLETERHAVFLEGLELVRRPVTQDRMVMRRGLQVLANRNHIDRMFAQIVQRAMNLLRGFAEAEHDPGLGRNVGVLRLEALQQFE